MPLPSDHQVGWRDEAFWNQKKEREARWRKEVRVITTWKFSSVSSNFFSFQPDLQRATESDESWSPILFEGRRRRGRWNVGHGQSLRISKQTAGKIISIEPYWTNWISKNQKIELRTGPLWPANPQEAQQKQRRLFCTRWYCLSPMLPYVAWCLCQVRLRGALNNCGISIDWFFSKLRILWSSMKLRSLFVAFLCLQLGPNEHIAVHHCTLSGLSNHLKETWRKCLGKRVRSKTTPWLRDSRCETQFGTRPQELRERRVRPANVDHKMLRVYVISMFHNTFFYIHTYIHIYIHVYI